ncbi:unnamed protein product [Cyclocybe aegerita]|uniref:DUF6533 domain-containing protein n=1 Tax=Cyclocybe aegerita TaxID=1973307 RepID=A0A8S0XQR9_CYCAE|nr:unnamed protein product [Cyclocybe aegerita]
MASRGRKVFLGRHGHGFSAPSKALITRRTRRGASSPTPPVARMDAILKPIIKGLQDIKTSHYSQLSSTSIILFDHLITFDQEVNLIWDSSWSLGKVLFLLNRYYTLAATIINNYAFFTPTLTDALDDNLGLRFFNWQGWTGLIGCMLAEGILQIRLYALYSLNKKVLVLMLSLFIISSATSGWIMGSALSKISARAIELPRGGKFCVPSGVSDTFYTFWIPMLAYEFLLCMLALIRGFQTFKTNGSLFQSGRQLVGILVRDSVLYFLVICSTYLTCMLVWLLAPTSLLEVPVGFSVAMSCVLANRVVLNVRKVSRDVDTTRFTSQKPLQSNHTPGTGTLSQYELEQLRSMRAQRPQSHIHIVGVVTQDEDLHPRYDSSKPFVVL